MDQIRNKGMASGSDIEKGHVDESFPVNVDRGGITVEQWKRTFDIKLWKAESPFPFSCCIFKVPKVLRRQKVQAFEPDVVSIGPFHRGADEKFKLVENVKEWYLKCLLLRMKTTLDSLIELTTGLEIRARVCYSDPCNHLDQNEFIEMLILDGCFLIELFRKAQSENRRDNDDPIFNVSCMLEYLYHDLLLLENQLPWFVLQSFYELIEGDSSKPLSEVVINFFKDSVADTNIFCHHKRQPEILHILDLIRTSLVQDYEVKKPKGVQRNKDSGANHLPQRIPCAAALSDAGVIFKSGPSGCILNIKFKEGIFTIPPLPIDERTGPLFRNLMAYEQCYHNCAHSITSYAVLMNNLIDSNVDVNLLCEKRIVANWLSADDALKVFSDLHNYTTVIDFEYEELYDNVRKYHESPWSWWREKLKRDYFDTPWATFSFFVVFVLLVLTFLQTIYTIQGFQAYNRPRP